MSKNINQRSFKINYDHKCRFLINGGCGIFDKTLLSAATPLNVHPGILPNYRGLDPVLWSLYNKDTLGATLHLMNCEIDKGDILISKYLDCCNLPKMFPLYNLE